MEKQELKDFAQSEDNWLELTVVNYIANKLQTQDLTRIVWPKTHTLYSGNICISKGFR